MSGRTPLYFGLHGLNDRESVLFKSCMNIISARTRHQWIWQKNVVNLLILTDESISQFSNSFKTLPIVCIGDKLPAIKHSDSRHEYLARPLRPMDILACVDRLGDFIIQNGSLGIDLRAMSNTTAVSAVRLRRWPPVQLLTDAYRTRLATLLTGQPVTLAWLQQRSGAPASVCADFLAELERADLLESTHITTPPKVIVNTAASNPKVGLLGRIRQRLGLNQAAAAYI